MRGRFVVVALVLLCAELAVTMPAGTASQALSCASFPDMPAAQLALEADPTTATTLDSNGNGQACEEIFDPESNDASAVPAGLPLLGGPDVDCIDLVYQEIAQNVLERNPGDPFHLDVNTDGFACSSLPSLNTLARQRSGAPVVAPAVAPVVVPAALPTAVPVVVDVPAVVDVPVTPEPAAAPNPGKKKGRKAAAATSHAAGAVTPGATVLPETAASANPDKKKGKKTAESGTP